VKTIFADDSTSSAVVGLNPRDLGRHIAATDEYLRDANGIGPTISHILGERGVRVIVLSDKSKCDELRDSSNAKCGATVDKGKVCPPPCVSRDRCSAPPSDGTTHIDTSFSWLLGKPAIMVTGTTPSTAKAGITNVVLGHQYALVQESFRECPAGATWLGDSYGWSTNPHPSQDSLRQTG
jgi:hypothetical protein